MSMSRHPVDDVSADDALADAPSTPDDVRSLAELDPEVPEADALEQAMEVPLDDDAERR